MHCSELSPSCLALPCCDVGVRVRCRRYEDHEEAKSKLAQEIGQDDDLLALESRDTYEVESIRYRVW